MRHICTMIVLVAAGSLLATAQRLDGCADLRAPGGQTVSHGVSQEDRDKGLKDAGYSLTRDSLVVALGDLRADVRSVAAGKLAENGGRAELTPMVNAYLAEKDGCTIGGMSLALDRIMGGIAWDAKQHPGGQYRVTPFQTCIESGPPTMSVTIEQTIDPYFSGPAVRVSFRNQTPQTLAFVKTASPMELFSVTISGPNGEPAKVAKGREWMYVPVVHGDPSVHRGASFRLAFQLLPPQEDVSWIWRIGEDFDMSSPGTYHVSFGGRLDYLDAMVCSNTLWMTVK